MSAARPSMPSAEPSLPSLPSADAPAPGPGKLVRTLGTVFPGVRHTGKQIEDFADEWQSRNVAALAAEKPVWVALGDSLAQGIGGSTIDHGYVGQLAGARADLVVVNFSRSGAKTTDVLVDQLPLVELLPQAPAVVTCNIGSNDLLRSFGIGATIRSLRLLIERLPDTAVMATLPDKGSLLAKRVNTTIRAECAARGIAVADVGRELTSWRGIMASDGFHPNDAGHQIWANAFAPHLL